MITFTTTIRVRYGETDQMGYLYYGYYAWYYEVGRVEALREMGIVYKAIEEEGTLMVVAQMHSTFLKPAKYDEELTVVTTIPTMPKLGVIPFDTEILNSANETIHKGSVKLICIDRKTRNKKRVPKQIIEPLKHYFEEKITK